MTLRAVIFDLDGVLTDTAEYHYRSWQRLADEEGWPFDREMNERHFEVQTLAGRHGTARPGADFRALVCPESGTMTRAVNSVTQPAVLLATGQ